MPTTWVATLTPSATIPLNVDYSTNPAGRQPERAPKRVPKRISLPQRMCFAKLWRMSCGRRPARPGVGEPIGGANSEAEASS
jgi:hypothetical protein